MATRKQKPSILIVGSNMRRIRNAKGYSLRDLEMKTGIDNGNLSKMERGEINILLGTVGKIAAGLEVYPFELLIPPGYGYKKVGE